MTDNIEGIRQTMNQPASSEVNVKRLFAGIAVAVLAVAGGGYWWTSSRAPVGSVTNMQPVSSTSAVPSMPSSSAPHGTEADQMASMTDRLAQRLKDQPQDAEGWAMLARSYSVLGRHLEAITAYEKAIALRKDDANLLADYADSLAMKNNRVLSGEPLKLVERALKIDSRNIKALSMAGSEAFVRQDYTKATYYWKQVAEFGPKDSPIVLQVLPNLEQAQKLASMATSAKP